MSFVVRSFILRSGRRVRSFSVLFVYLFPFLLFGHQDHDAERDPIKLFALVHRKAPEATDIVSTGFNGFEALIMAFENNFGPRLSSLKELYLYNASRRSFWTLPDGDHSEYHKAFELFATSDHIALG